MAEQRRVYRATGARSVEDLQEQINFLMAQLAERLDQIEGYRGTPTFRSNVNMTGKKIQSLAIGTSSGEAMTADLDTNPGLSISSTMGLSVKADATRAIDRDSSGVFARIDDESLELEEDPRDKKKKRIRAKLKNEGGIQIDQTPQTGGLYVDASWVDHGGLSGLSDDDHPQYLLKSGTSSLEISDEFGQVIHAFYIGA